MKLTVIGIGQSLRGDDAAGLEIVRRWQEKFPETARRPEVRVEACELPGLNLLSLMEGAEAVILVDGVRSSARPGAIHQLTREQLTAFHAESKSAHGWGVAETLSLAETLALPAASVPIRVIGIEIGQTETGAPLSKDVAEALDAACEAIEEEAQALLQTIVRV